MRRKNYKGRCVKISSKKSDSICKTYDEIQFEYLKLLEQDESVKEIKCNVVFDDEELKEFMTDFVCVAANGELIVRECVNRNLLTKPLTVKLLDASRNYWLKHGIKDWGLVINAEE